MKFEPIIKSLLETDLYKFSMGQAIFHNASKYKTTWSFKCRNKDVKFTLEMVQEIKEQIKAFCNLRFTEDELNYLKSISWLDESYVDYLHNFAPNSGLRITLMSYLKSLREEQTKSLRVL